MIDTAEKTTTEKRDIIKSLWQSLPHGSKGEIRRMIVDEINAKEGREVISYGSAKTHWFADDYQVNKSYLDFVIAKLKKLQSNAKS